MVQNTASMVKTQEKTFAEQNAALRQVSALKNIALPALDKTEFIASPAKFGRVSRIKFPINVRFANTKAQNRNSTFRRVLAAATVKQYLLHTLGSFSSRGIQCGDLLKSKRIIQTK